MCVHCLSHLKGREVVSAHYSLGPVGKVDPCSLGCREVALEGGSSIGIAHDWGDLDGASEEEGVGEFLSLPLVLGDGVSELDGVEA